MSAGLAAAAAAVGCEESGNRDGQSTDTRMRISLVNQFSLPGRALLTFSMRETMAGSRAGHDELEQITTEKRQRTGDGRAIKEKENPLVHGAVSGDLPQDVIARLDLHGGHVDGCWRSRRAEGNEAEGLERAGGWRAAVCLARAHLDQPWRVWDCGGCCTEYSAFHIAARWLGGVRTPQFGCNAAPEVSPMYKTMYKIGTWML